MIKKGIWLSIFLITIMSLFLSSVGSAVDENAPTKVALTAKEKNLPEPVKVAVVESPEPKPATAQNITNSIGMTFVYVKPGTFMMGSPPNATVREDDETYHQVTISRPFYMQTTEVTQGQWKRIMGNNPSQFNSCGEDCPVEQVSWNDVQDFIRRLNQQEKTDKYRLPTEAEWEYAATSGGQQEQFAGTNSEPDLGEYAWRASNSEGKTHPVGQKKPNSLGLYDMSGNVWEWVQDWKGDYPSDNITDPTGPSSGTNRVTRGGCWASQAHICRSAVRFGVVSDRGIGRLGFRLVRAN